MGQARMGLQRLPHPTSKNTFSKIIYFQVCWVRPAREHREINSICRSQQSDVKWTKTSDTNPRLREVRSWIQYPVDLFDLVETPAEQYQAVQGDEKNLVKVKELF